MVGGEVMVRLCVLIALRWVLMNLLLLICSLMGMWIRLGSRTLLIGVISVLVTLRLLARRLNMFGYGLFVTLVKLLQDVLTFVRC